MLYKPQKPIQAYGILLVSGGPMMEGLEHLAKGFAQVVCITLRGPSLRLPIVT